MNKDDSQFPVRAGKPTSHSIIQNTDMNISHKSAKLHVGLGAGTLHVPGAEPLSAAKPMVVSGKGKAKDMGAIFRLIMANKPKDER